MYVVGVGGKILPPQMGVGHTERTTQDQEGENSRSQDPKGECFSF